MKLDISSIYSNKNIQTDFFHSLSKVLLFLLVSFFVLTQSACSKSTDTGKITKTEVNKELTQKQIDSNAKTKAMRQARRDAALASVNLSYVDQSKIVSNGDDFGVKVLAVRRTANGYMLDFRFRITDIEKATEIMQRKIKARLTIEKDNSTLHVPVSYKLGALRQSGANLLENKNYFMFFANPGNHVKEGDLVTFELGGFKAEHITVN